MRTKTLYSGQLSDNLSLSLVEVNHREHLFSTGYKVVFKTYCDNSLRVKEKTYSDLDSALNVIERLEYKFNTRLERV
jgi:hypothetical protein